MLHTPPPRKSFFSRQELALVGITMLWGATFLIVHVAVGHAGPLFFVGLRFVTAGLLGLLVFRKALSGLTRRELMAGAAIGVTIFLGYALQTYGLQTINSSTSAFLTALYVPMVPLLQWLFMRRAPQMMAWVGIALAFVGLVLLAGPQALHVGLGRGEIATIVSAVAIAGEIILIGRFAGDVDSSRVTVVQLLSGGLLSLAAMPLAGEAVPAFSWVWLAAGLGLGVASALIQLTMNWAQKSVSPTRATIIYASEPVWAGVVGKLADDRLPALAVLGAGFIVAGVIASEWKPRRLPSSGRTDDGLVADRAG
ncbi:Threonine/homoserine efflux transporter RhtA [Sphingomonas gellani]|uniref:Threonine/homoserine efflux transporter RhtA n=1 Tax=Sphingomonas gellani TaxID=1166340 RepID=A0A1H8J4L4_9SPHN|nr:DMT family transporter [Sphingomonas gellani]SEN75893.1 Threonine/homoserine efflux transporter RhtA [Sphingomonas gellani]